MTSFSNKGVRQGRRGQPSLVPGSAGGGQLPSQATTPTCPVRPSVLLWADCKICTSSSAAPNASSLVPGSRIPPRAGSTGLEQERYLGVCTSQRCPPVPRVPSVHHISEALCCCLYGHHTAFLSYDGPGVRAGSVTSVV